MEPNKYKRYFDKDSPKREKIRLIFFPFLLLTLVIITLCGVIYWHLVYEKGMDKYYVGFGVLLLIGFGSVFIRRRMSLLENAASDRLLWLVYGMSMFFPILFLQSYIDKSIGDLTRLADITEVADYPPSRFYTVENPTRITQPVLDFTYIESIDGSVLKEQILKTYCIAPIFSSNRAVWLGKMYKSEAFYPDKKQTIVNSFVPASVKKFEEDACKAFTYLERITLNEKNGYYRALGTSATKPNKITILIPHYQSFDERAGNTLCYILLAYVIGTGLFLLMVIGSPFNEKRLHCFLTGERYIDISSLPPSKVVKWKKVANDKLVFVSGITKQKLENDLKEVCDLYNSDGARMYPELQQLGDREFAITFPYDIDFVSFYYLINFLCYPMSGGERAEVTGWTKAVAGDRWITKRIAGKQLMLYIPEEDEEYDNVYVTTEYGECYKFSFDGKTDSLAKQYRPYQESIIHQIDGTPK